MNGTTETLQYWLLSQIVHNDRWHSSAPSAKISVRHQGPALSARGSAKIGTSHMTFRPLHDRVLVRRIEAQEKTAGGIIIPDTAKEKPQEGEVISVGTGTRG